MRFRAAFGGAEISYRTTAADDELVRRERTTVNSKSAMETRSKVPAAIHASRSRFARLNAVLRNTSVSNDGADVSCADKVAPDERESASRAKARSVAVWNRRAGCFSRHRRMIFSSA